MCAIVHFPLSFPPFFFSSWCWLSGAMHAASASSEHAFSPARHVIEACWNRLNPDTANSVLFLYSAAKQQTITLQSSPTHMANFQLTVAMWQMLSLCVRAEKRQSSCSKFKLIEMFRPLATLFNNKYQSLEKFVYFYIFHLLYLALILPLSWVRDKGKEKREVELCLGLLGSQQWPQHRSAACSQAGPLLHLSLKCLHGETRFLSVALGTGCWLARIFTSRAVQVGSHYGLGGCQD